MARSLSLQVCFRNRGSGLLPPAVLAPVNIWVACRHGWKPFTMRKRVFLPLATWSVALAGLIEYLAQKSLREGGLALSPTINDIPNLAKFTYMFLPTIIAVIYSIVWNWVDLDVKRIHPWLELSREDGAVAKNSLALDYPYDFVALVPFKAAKRRYVTPEGSVPLAVILSLLQPLERLLVRNNSDGHILDHHSPSRCHLRNRTRSRSPTGPFLYNLRPDPQRRTVSGPRHFRAPSALRRQISRPIVSPLHHSRIRPPAIQVAVR